MPKDTPHPRSWLGSHIPYEAGLSDADTIAKDIAIHKLSANESAHGVSPAVQRVIHQAATHCHRYPDPSLVQLRRALAAHHDLNLDGIVCGNGSDELITLLLHAYGGEGRSIVMGQYGFIYYEIAAMAAGMTVRKAQECPRKGVAIDAIAQLYDDTTACVFIANPNNPTGALLSPSDIERLIALTPPHILIVLDAAYAEYVDDAAYDGGARWVERHDNVVMLRTFSKIYGLSALRVGWCYAPPAIASVLQRLRSPFNVNAIGQAAAVAALADTARTDQLRLDNHEAKQKVRDALAHTAIEVIPSWGNFLLLRFASPEHARDADAYLQHRGILLRRLEAYDLHDCLRVTMGAEDSLQIFTKTLCEFMAQSGGEATL